MYTQERPTLNLPQISMHASPPPVSKSMVLKPDFPVQERKTCDPHREPLTPLFPCRYPTQQRPPVNPTLCPHTPTHIHHIQSSTRFSLAFPRGFLCLWNLASLPGPGELTRSIIHQSPCTQPHDAFQECDPKDEENAMGSETFHCILATHHDHILGSQVVSPLPDREELVP